MSNNYALRIRQRKVRENPTTMEPMDIRPGDVYTLRKPHPCGSYDWRVIRTGADVGMRCMGCNHKVFLQRAEFERRVKTLVERLQPETINDTATL